MLRRLRIQRFKSIYEELLDFGQVNLFIGPNGSGKSNLLEALGVLSAALSLGLDPNTLDLKGVRLSLPHLFKSAFKNHDLPKTFRLEAEFDHGRYECSIRSGARSSFLEFFSEALYDGAKQVFGRSQHGIKLHQGGTTVTPFDPDSLSSTRSVWSAIEPFVDISQGLRSELEEFSRFAIYAPQTAVMRGMAVDNRVVEPLGLTGSGLASAFRYAQLANSPDFQKIIQVIWEPGWANEIITGGFDPEIVPSQVRAGGHLLYIRDRFMRSGRNMLSAFDASEGTLYLIFVATLLVHDETPRVFALDNVDGTLNPKLVRQLASHVVSVVTSDPQRQVFMTSHHPSALNSFDIFDDAHRVFVSRRRSSKDTGSPGSTLYMRLEPPSHMSKED